MLCEEAPVRIREMEGWKVGWAREDDHIKQVMAPGHQVQRCVYVDFLNTGPAVAKTLRTQIGRADNLRRAGELTITSVVVDGGKVVGAVGLNMETGEAVKISAKAVILAAGGLTRLYRRNSASVNMGGDSYALALRAGADLVDMEFVQFFPIGHLAPRMVGMDPIMWDPFRYKLGGRLLNSEGEEFVHKYGHAEVTDKYTAPRDVASFAILQEVAAGRGSPAGGAFLSFQHIPEAELTGGVRAGDRSIGGERDRPYERRYRGVAHRALPHGRRPGRHAHGKAVARSVRGWGGGRRRQWGKSAVRQRHSGSLRLWRAGRTVCRRVGGGEPVGPMPPPPRHWKKYRQAAMSPRRDPVRGWLGCSSSCRN